MTKYILLAALNIVPVGHEQLAEIDTRYDLSLYATYNRENDKLLFYGCKLSNDNKIVNRHIVVRDMASGQNTIVESGNYFSPIGWVDSSTVLLYNVVRLDGILSNNSRFRRMVYTYDIHTRDTTHIQGVPADKCKTNMIVNSNSIVYRIRERNGSHLFKYDLRTGITTEFEQLKNRNIGHLSFAFDEGSGVLAFVETESNTERLKVLRNDSIFVVDEIAGTIDQVMLDGKLNRLYYLSYLGPFDSPTKLIQYYDFQTQGIVPYYQLNGEVTCNRLSAYSSEHLILSLSASNEVRVNGRMVGDRTEINVISKSPKGIYICTPK